MRIAILKHRKIPVTLDFMRVSAIYRFVTHKFSEQEKTPETRSFRGHPERRRPDLNRWILVLQTIALPLGYCAIFN
jgi:hypothetical protein